MTSRIANKLRRTSFYVSLLFSFAAAAAQPRVDALQNNYSYILPGMPNYGIAQGSIFIVKGVNLAPSSTGLQSLPLQTAVNGVSATVSVGGATTDVLLYYVTPQQLGGILPSATPAGTGTIVVNNNGQRSQPFPILVVRSAFGILTFSGTGLGPAAVFDSQNVFLYTENAANPGDTIVFYGTGLGPVPGNESIQQTPENLNSTPITVEIGGRPAIVSYRGRSIYPGLDQINVVVPSGVPFGCYVSLTVRTGAISSNSTTIPVAASGRACTFEPSQYSRNDLGAIAGKASFTQSRVGLIREIGLTPSGVTSSRDIIYAIFNRVTPLIDNSTYLYLVGSGGYDIPSAGNCVSYGYPVGGSAVLYPLSISPFIDAGGAISFTAPGGSSSFNQNTAAVLPSVAIPTAGGPVDFRGFGGSEVGAFSARVTLPTLTWTNTSALGVVSRSQDLRLTWTTNQTNGYVVIRGISEDRSQGVVGAFSCVARAADGQFVVPATVLATIPATSAGSVGSSIAVEHFTWGRHSAPSLDLGYTRSDVKNTLATRFQ